MKVKLVRRVSDEIELEKNMVFEIKGEKMVFLERLNEVSQIKFYTLLSLTEPTEGDVILHTSKIDIVVKFLEQEKASFAGLFKDFITPF